jgi:hypothetical protein
MRSFIVCFWLRVKISEAGRVVKLNFTPFPSLHGIGSDNVAFAIHVATVFQNHKGFFGEAALFVALPLNVCNADVKRGRRHVVAIQGADFEFADLVVVHFVFWLGAKVAEERKEIKF